MSASRTPFQFTFRHPAPWEQSANLDVDTLCDDCRQLDLERSYAQAFHLYEGTRRGHYKRPLASCRKGDGPVYLKDFYYVTSLGDRLSRTTDCKLCKFLAQMTTEPAKGTYKLLAFCSSESYLFEPRRKDVRGRLIRRPWERTKVDIGPGGSLTTRWCVPLEHNVFMAVVPEVEGVPRTGVPLRWFETQLPKNGSIYRLTAPERDTHRLTLPRELGPEADFSLMRAWLTRCRCKHNDCASRKPPNATLRGFRVINCWKQPPDNIEVRPWSERYVALSYVWGPPSGDWPRTILDAVEVTKRLGERYLWVDRLCIDQSNVEEKMVLISKMDAIYEGAEFTIVCAAGDARTGLPGVNATRRASQPRVELVQRSKGKGKKAVRDAPDWTHEVLGVTEEEYDADRAGEAGYLDPLRFRLKGQMTVDFGELLQDQKLTEKYEIPQSHLQWYRDFAEDLDHPVEEFLEKMKLLAYRMGMPFKELVPHFKREAADDQSIEEDGANLPMPTRPLVDPSKAEAFLPVNTTEGKLVLLSTMQEPRKTIRDSEWATRGWTYQEGVLSNRRLVFTGEQAYWECRGMAVCEAVHIPLNSVKDPSGARMADFMLSGIFDEDLHHDTELQYGFQPTGQADVGDQVLALDGHIHAFTSRKLSFEGDSLNAFLGVAARYKSDAGLLLLLGIPVWAGALADDKPGLQHTFALSISSWTHTSHRREEESELYIADCPRRRQFPSWTWTGWQGAVEFCNEKESKPHGSEDAGAMLGTIRVVPGDTCLTPGATFLEVPAGVDPSHSDFFRALTSKDWVRSVDRIWSAEMVLHSPDGTEETLLTGWAPIWNTGDPNKSWLLTIKQPLILQRGYLLQSATGSPWRKILGKVARVHLSVPMTEEQLTAGYKKRHIVAVLVFASTVPYVWNGIARFLILRRVGESSRTRWERIGRLNLWITEREMGTYANVGKMLTALPIWKLTWDITIV